MARLIIGRPEVRILQALSRFEQLTAEQLARHLAYSYRYTQDKCKDLTDGKYLQRLTLPKRQREGSVPYVYTLARKGRQHLDNSDKDAGTQVKKRYRPSEEQARLHTLAASEVLLTVMQATELDPTLSLVRCIKDREFRTDPITVTIPARPKRRTVSLIPDLWLHLRHRSAGDTYSYFFCIEVNLTPVEQKRWREKVSMYLNCKEGYRNRVGVDVFQVVTFILSPEVVLRPATGRYSERERIERDNALRHNEKRKRDYLLWTERELAQQNKEGEADRFFYTNRPFDSLTPVELVFAEHFSMPYEPDPLSLLPTE